MIARLAACTALALVTAPMATTPAHAAAAKSVSIDLDDATTASGAASSVTVDLSDTPARRLEIADLAYLSTATARFAPQDQLSAPSKAMPSGASIADMPSAGDVVFSANRTDRLSPTLADPIRRNPIILLPGILPGAVPEPSTWAMLILGFGVIGVAMRSRRTKVSFI